MKHLTPTLLVIALSHAAQAQNAKAIAARATQAIKQIKTLQYTLEASSPTEPKIRATVFLQNVKAQEPGPLSGHYWVSGEFDRGAKGRETFAFSYDGKAFRYLGAKQNKVEVIDAPSIAEVVMLLPMEIAFMPINPFRFPGDSITKMAHGGRKTIAGFDCDIVEVTREVEGKMNDTLVFTNRWGIDRKSNLPVFFDSGRGLTKTILSMEVDVPRDDSRFKLAATEVKIAKMDTLAKGLLPVGQKAPDFAVKDSTGKTLRLADFKGKLLLIDFWATWCQPCVKSMPELKTLYERHKNKGLSVVSMAVANADGKPTEYMRSKGYNWTSVPSGDSAGKAYKAVVIPTLYLIGKDGKILFRISGAHETTKAQLDALIRRHLGA